LRSEAGHTQVSAEGEGGGGLYRGLYQRGDGFGRRSGHPVGARGGGVLRLVQDGGGFQSSGQARNSQGEGGRQRGRGLYQRGHGFGRRSGHPVGARVGAVPRLVQHRGGFQSSGQAGGSQG